jgi:Peptidase family C25/Secretion system C-terminal sorting domain/Propeptide_C25
MKRLMLTVLFALFFTMSGVAADLVPLQPDVSAEPLQVNVLDETANGLSLNLEATGIFSESLGADAAGHALLSWPNAGVEGIIGNPQLPVRRMLVAIPYGATVQANVTSANWTEYSLFDLTGESALMPVQPPREKIEGVVVPFTKNMSAYQVSSYGDRAVVEVEEYIVVRGQQMALVTVRLVMYNPVSGSVRIASDLNVQLDFVGGDAALTAQKAARYHDVRTINLIQESVINDPGRELDELPQSLGYTIIAPNNATYLTAMEPYIDWKKAQGWEVTVALTSDIGTSTTAIKAYLQDEYDNAAVPPSFVLLLGDTDLIPYWVGGGTGNPNTDLNYVQLEGADYMPDAGIGRFSIANVTDLQNVINKTFNYEQVLWGDNTWVTHSNFMASVDNYAISEGTHNFVLNNYLWPAGFTADRLYQVTFGASTADVTNSFNAGVNLGTYSGHGSEYSWADGPPFNQANVNALTNTVYPFVQSYACITGSFHLAECFAETWMRHSSGSFAIMASSVNSYWTEDDVMEKKVFEAFFDNQTPGDDYDITWVNGMIDYSKLKLYEQWGNTGTIRRYCEMYNIMGDGSVDLWTTVPQDVTVGHPAAFFLGMDEIDVSVPDAPAWARVCVVSSAQPEIIASGYTDEAGNLTLTLPVAPTLPGTLNITVTGHNIDPYEVQIPLTAAEGPYVAFESVVVDDALGWNPNGQLDYDESAVLDVTLQNVGVETCMDPLVTVTGWPVEVNMPEFTEVWPEILPGASVTEFGAFSIEVIQPVVDGYLCQLPLEIVRDLYTWESTMPITIHAPVSEVTDLAFSEDPNGNNWLDPGESAWITVTLTNNGSAPIVEGYALLLGNGDPYVDIITDNVEYFPVLNPGQSVEMGWGIIASPDCPQDYDMSLLLDLDADHGIDVNIDIPMTVGDILFLPTGPDAYGYEAYDPFDGNNGLPYNWVEISTAEGGPGTDTGITGDDQSVHQNLPFNFIYYGQVYDGLTIDSNGWIALGATTQGSDYSNTTIPNADGASAMIAPYWEDLNPSRNGCDGIYTWHDTANHRFVVEWSVIDQFTPSGNYETFEVILYDPVFHPTATGDGIIQFQYLDITAEVGNDGTVGIENPTETDGVLYVFQDTYDVHASPITDGFSITIATAMGEPLAAPTNLTYDLAGDGTVTLDWAFAGRYTFDQLTQPTATRPGDKPDVMREEDEIQLQDWLTNGLPTDELDDFLNFNVYRDNVQIGQPVLTTFIDNLFQTGEYEYYVTALHDEGESFPSNSVTVDYQPQLTLDITPISNTIFPSGGNVIYSAHLVSTMPDPVQDMHYWTMVTLPNGNTIGPVFQQQFNLAAFADIFVPQIRQNVPGAAPGGDYLHECFVGFWPATIGAYDSFIFTKLGGNADAQIDLSEWTCSGFDIEETVIAVSDPLPESFEVGRAYPNPFNATVSIPFALPNAGEVTLALYNVLGQQVMARTIHSEAGYQTMTVDGSALSSGVYLLSVDGFGTIQHQKLMLLK